MSVEVKLELGHCACLRDKPTPEGFTHDWTVFVKGPGSGAEANSIQYFVDKVVFYLHESFPKPKRVIKEPPYQVSESGYASFIMPIEVFFHTKEEPKKVCFEYDLYLRIDGPPVSSNIRYEKVTFQNPTEDFRRKLITVGGSVEVKLELGHRACLRDKRTPEGYTHDWTVFVTGPGSGAEANSIQYFVDKVVFCLHESFPEPKRIIKEPPYQVSESGYASFIMPIEVFFRSKEEPKKVCFEYDLCLRLDGPPVSSNIRYEKVTFQNPTEDFRRKLITAGGSVEVKLELGHRACLRDKPTPEGYTHDWTVFVKGPGSGAEANSIQYFVDKVVFYLHESFPEPKRVIKEPPYQVSESGYASFIMPIEVFFHTKEEPKKVCFEYDLYLRLDGPPVSSNIRYEKVTFQNPTEDFRRKLITAGGVMISQCTQI